MNILQLGKFYPVRGGVEKVMYDLTEGLSQRGIHCDMMCTIGENEDRVIKLNDNGEIIGCKSYIKLAATTLSFSMIYKLKKICTRYDIIHIHHPDPMACLALYLSGYKGKVILHWHSDILKQKKLLILYSPLQKWLIKRADLIVGTTPVYIKASPYLKHVQAKTTFLPIGVQEELPVPAEVQKIRNKYAGKKIVFSLGRLVDYKGYRYLIEAASYLNDEYVILIGGQGPLQTELQDYIHNQNLSSKVALLGYIPETLKSAYFSACDIFCISSIQKTEAFAIVQVEAMSHGKPVVATEISGSGVPWVNKHGVSGINCIPGSGKDIAASIKKIFYNTDTYNEFSKNALMWYQYSFTMDKMIENCLKIYNDLL